MTKLGHKLRYLLLILASTAVLLLLTYKFGLCNTLHLGFLMVNDKDIQYDRNMPLIIIGGVPHSGASLLGAMLDARSDVRCDEEIFVNSLVFKMFEDWREREQPLLDEVGVSKNVLDAAVAAFILATLALEGEPARRLCTNSPFMLRSADRVSRIFPQAKFIFVVRDGRAVFHSIIANEIMFHGYSISNPRATLKCWNIDVSAIYYQCKLLGNRRCMIVQYEQLVLHPEPLMKQVVSFLEVPWDESVLSYGRNDKQSLVLKKFGSDPVESPIKVDPLTKWVDQFPLDVVKDMETIAPMLVTLGYDTTANPPNGSTSDKFLRHINQTYNKYS